MKFRHTNFMRLIYATLLALPFVAILSRVIYVQSNKNAYQSAEIESEYETYSINYQYETNEVNTVDDLVIGNIYKVQIDLNDYYNSGNLLYTTGIFHLQATEYDIINVHANEGYSIRLLYDYNASNIRLYLTTSSYVIFTPSSEIITFYCLYYDNTNFNNLTYSISDYLGEETINIETHTGITLDNVFEYSVNKFIQNNNFGKINLFQWTTDLFFDSNDVNNMYVGFINWYLNYTLLVSATYILFLVLMWFINYARRLLERGMNYDW